MLELCMPELHAQIDWSIKPESLEQELNKLLPDGDNGGRVMDKLYKVFLKTGETLEILIQIELQVQYDPDFPHHDDYLSPNHRCSAKTAHQSYYSR